ncbi:TPA: hypothetical protein DEO28_01895 [Candidatus Dependentiae bacterium]|nr:MAG: hypothetical protein UR14_C0004G0064 [candidate division TM6 bacterium GW2011_GWE2_31_21]KKP52983.1 MAG: hypothetical protein UR43_C0008G0065 [candidate division TM6 bacterium GW2011_GWF2_33_332]HBS47779.1 hypothetical protein [Candidatus Dependentiae bacterium]HBZ73245.1 hypothetical protein [Candidatus Dependentiae bacterium]
MKQLKILTLLGAACLFTSLAAVVQVSQSSSVTNFAQNISAKAYDRYTGTFYLGTQQPNFNYSLAMAGRDATVFTPLATAAYDAFNYAITTTSLGLINNGGGAATHLVFTTTNPFLNAVVLTDANYVTTGLAVRLTGTDSNASSFDTVVGSTEFAFLRVHGFPGTDSLGSGITAVWFSGTSAPHLMGNAVKWNSAKGTYYGDGSPMRIASADSVMTLSPHVNDLYWNPTFATLFITGTVNARNVGAATTDYYSAISTATIAGGTLVLRDILPYGVNPAASNLKTIFAYTNASNASIASININKIRTMTTSTGNNYLIVNGGIEQYGATTSVGNNIYCLRYSTTEYQVIQNKSYYVNLPNNFNEVTLAGDSAYSLTVGGGTAPWASTSYASDMEVVGDTVYVSFHSSLAARDANNDFGVWSSQALFDNNGTIIGWTKWERVMTSFGGFDTPNIYQDKARFFSVDAKTGKVWEVVNESTDTNPRIVYRTSWITSSFTADSLPYKLNQDSFFNDYGISCCLDLVAGTTSLYNPSNPYNSMALFGGYQQVAMALTSFGNQRETNYEDYNFGTPLQYYSKTTLPNSAMVRCLQFSRPMMEAAATKGYFFAGTDNGLYVYAKTASPYAGFDTSRGSGGISDNLGTFFSTPDTYAWRKMSSSSIEGTVSQIESDGVYIYVVEQDITSIGSLKSRLWRITLANDVTAMTTVTKIAESGATRSIPTNAVISGFKIVTNATGQLVYGVLSTNAGVFDSNVSLTGFDMGVLAHSWTTIDSTRCYHSLYAPKHTPTSSIPDYNGQSTKLFGISFSDPGLQNYYQNSQFNIINSPFAASPVVRSDYTNSSSSITYLDRSLSFYTDGGRRLFTRFDPTETLTYSSLDSLPYNSAEWNMSAPFAPSEIGVNADISRIHWIENISGIGTILAGTDNGVISLE